MVVFSRRIALDVIGYSYCTLRESAFDDIFLEMKYVFALTDMLVGNTSRHTLCIKTNCKTGKTVLRRADFCVFKLRRKFACYRNKLLTRDLIKYKNNRTAAIWSTTFSFTVIFSAVCSPYMSITPGEWQKLQQGFGLFPIRSSAYRDGLRTVWAKCNHNFRGPT